MQVPSSTVGLVDSTLAYHPGNPDSIPGWGIDEISSKFPDILFISKEILNAEISKIGPWYMDFVLLRARQSFVLLRAGKSFVLLRAGKSP